MAKELVGIKYKLVFSTEKKKLRIRVRIKSDKFKEERKNQK